MLKIKDNVDLETLRKYGFTIKYNERTGKPCYFAIFNKDFDGEITKVRIYVDTNDNNKLKSDFLHSLNDYANILYDLIKANLVEKC